MLVYDVIKNCDIAQAIRIYLNDWADDEELMKRDKTIAKIYNFWKMVCELTPNPSSEDILIASEGYDENGKTIIAVSLYEKDDLEDSLYIIHEKEFPVYSPEDSLEILDDIYKEVCSWFPPSYDYEWTPWENILGFTVFKENIERNGADAVAAYMFYEMTFDGCAREVRDVRIDGIAELLCDTIKDIENCHADDMVESTDKDIEKVTDEECENILKEMQINTGHTDDERRSMMLEILRDMEMDFKELKMVCADRGLQKDKEEVS